MHTVSGFLPTNPELNAFQNTDAKTKDMSRKVCVAKFGCWVSKFNIKVVPARASGIINIGLRLLASEYFRLNAAFSMSKAII